MNQVYYRGNAYNYEKIELNGTCVFALFRDGQLVQYAQEEELDIRSRVSLILDAYYTGKHSSISTPAIN